MKTLLRGAVALAFAASAAVAVARPSGDEREFSRQEVTESESETTITETYSTDAPAEGPEARASYDDDGSSSGQSLDPGERSSGATAEGELEEPGLMHDGGG